MISLDNFKLINSQNWSFNAQFWVQHVEEEENRAGLLYEIIAGKINKINGIEKNSQKKKESLIVDMGCGEGSFIRKCVRNNIESKFVGIDACEHFIRKAQERDSYNTYLVGDIEGNVPINNGVADIVVSLLSLIEIVDINKSITEMVRIMSKNGNLIICILHPIVDIIRLQVSNQEKAYLIDQYISFGSVIIKKNIKIKDKIYSRHYYRIHHNLNKYIESINNNNLTLNEYCEIYRPIELRNDIEKMNPVFILMHLKR